MNPNKSSQYRSIRLTGFLLFAAVAGLLFSRPVYAEGTITMSVTPETAAVGDAVTVSFEASGTADAAEAPEILITYDPNRLDIVDCDKEYGGGGGQLQFTDTAATITFNVISGGVAEIKGSARFDAETADGACYVTVDGEDTAAALAAEAESTVDLATQGIPSTDGGKKIIHPVFDEEAMPALFHKITTDYNGETVEAAAFDMGDITLLYVSDNPDTGTEGFNIYNEATGELEDFKMIQGIENRYIIILKAPESVQAPNGFTKAALQWDGLTLEAYAVNAIDSTVITDVPPTDFFLLYAISSEGNKGWYLYDQVGGTYQRYLPITNSSVNTEEEEGGFFSSLMNDISGDSEETDYKAVSFRRLIIIGVMGLVMLIMLIFLLICIFKLRDYQSYDYIDEDEEEAYARQNTRREPSVEETSRIRASELARMEMGETFEPVDFDKLVNDPHANDKPGQPTPVKSVTTPEAAAAKLGAPAPQSATSAAPATPASTLPKHAQPLKEAVPSADTTKPEAPKADAAKTDDVKTDAVKTDAVKPDAVKSAAAPAASAASVTPAAPAASATPVTPATPAAGAPKAQSGTPINAASVSDFVRPANPAPTPAPARQAPAAPAPAPKQEFRDDYEEEEGGGLFSRKSREEKKKEKKRKKALDFDEPEQIDWSSLEGTIKDSDDRRPKGTDSPFSKLMQESTAAAAPAAAAAATGVPAVETPKVKVELPTDIPKPDNGKAVKPASQIHKETVPQQESGYWQQSSAQQYSEQPYAQDSHDGYAQSSQQQQSYQQSYDSYGQNYQQGYQQGYDQYGQQYGQNYQQGYDPYAQNYQQGYDPYSQGYTQNYGYNQGYQQGYDPYAQGYQQGYDQYGQYNGYAPYGNPGYNTQNIDLDDDFEFEFIDINRN